MRTARLMVPAIIAIAFSVTAGPAGALSPEVNRLDEWSGPGTADTIQVGNIQHVAQVPYPSGTDLEFTTKVVTKLSNGATGDPVCERNASGNCVVDAEGNIVYQTEARDFVMAGTAGQAGRVIDITDPRNPVQVGLLPCRLNQGDVQVWGNYVLQAADGTGSCTRPQGGTTTATVGISDISDPRNPFYVGKVTISQGAHNVTVHPTQPLMYISDQELAGPGTIRIYDFSNPASPTLVTNWVYAAGPAHDTTFNPSGTRAYIAAISATVIANTENPRAPSIVSVIPNEGISISHQSDPTPDGKFLLVGDEVGGGAAPTVSPGGPVHVYDISVEQHPQKIGAFGNDTINAGTVSTAHVFRINPDGYTMGIGWYNDGAGVIDFSDVRGLNAAGVGSAAGTGPRVIAWLKMPSANVWAAKMWQERHPGYLFANDQARGLDVFYLPELADGFIGSGSIHAGDPSTNTAGKAQSEFVTANNCNGRPVSQGLDGYVYEDLPASAGDGQKKVYVTTSGPGNSATDIAIRFYSGTCALLNSTPAEPGATVPAGTRHIVVNAVTGANIRILTYVR